MVRERTVKTGMVLKAQSMILRVADVRGDWVKFEYWDSTTQNWRPRGYTENRHKVEEKVKSKHWEIV